MNFIDTHTHLDGEEFDADRDETIQRAKDAGVSKVFIPAIDMPSVSRVLAVCDRYPGYAYPMIGLHPEEVRADWQDVLKEMKPVLDANRDKIIAVGEVGLDYYWSREFEQEQLLAFEEQMVDRVSAAADDTLPEGTERNGASVAPLREGTAWRCFPLLYRQREGGCRTAVVRQVCTRHRWSADFQEISFAGGVAHSSARQNCA